MGAGTDARVELWLTGTNGKTVGPIRVSEQGGDSMEQGQTNPITIRLIDEISHIYKVTVRQDGSKMADQWHLNKIVLVGKNPKTNETLPGNTFFRRQLIESNTVFHAGTENIILVLELNFKCFNANTVRSLCLNVLFGLKISHMKIF